MSYIQQHIQDHCKTAQDVQQAAIKVARFRHSLRPTTSSALRPTKTTSSIIINPLPPLPKDWLYVASENSLVDKFPPNFIKYIKKLVCKSFNYSQTDMDSARKSRENIEPRHTAFYLSKVFSDKSLPQIGKIFGGKDHTTILNAIRKIPKKMRASAHMCQIVVELEEHLKQELKKWREGGHYEPNS